MRRLFVSLVVGVLTVPWLAGAALADPPGNNGTVKIQEVGDNEEIPDNDPHVGCSFQIEFRGFDQGDLDASYALTAHPPSGQGAVVRSQTDIPIGDDAAGGANDVDEIVVLTLTSADLAGLVRHPQQGFHLKLTVHAEGSIGADTKHKVFWVGGCPSGSELAPPVGERITSQESSVDADASASDSPPYLPGIVVVAVVGVALMAMLQPIRGLLKERTANRTD